MLTAKSGSKVFRQLIEVFAHMNSTCPLAWTPWGPCARRNDAGHHVARPGDLDLVGLAGLHGSDEP